MAGKRKNTGLGKGLEALFSDTEHTSLQENGAETGQGAGEGVKILPLDELKPNVNQPRKSFDPDALEDLAASIREHGLIQPVIVREAKRGYEIVAGERRWRAARQAGLTEIPCLVRELDEEELALFAIVENMQREDLNPVEEAEGLSRMISQFGLTQEQVSRSVGKSRPYITNALRLLKLSSPVKEYLAEGKLSGGHARALLGLSEARQRALADRIVREGLSVRAVEELAGGKTTPRRKARPMRKSADVLQVEDDLKRALGTKVNLKTSGKRGTIEIEYYNEEERERLIALLRSI